MFFHRPIVFHCLFFGGLASDAFRRPPTRADDVYIGFLPLAHVLELMAECCILAHGGRIGYSNAQQVCVLATSVARGLCFQRAFFALSHSMWICYLTFPTVWYPL